MEDKKKVLIGILSVLVCIMAVGYALLAQELTINGSASIDSTWRVEITNIASKDVVGDAVNKVDPSYTATTANFSVGFTQPGDSITYDIEVTNKGTLDAENTSSWVYQNFGENQNRPYGYWTMTPNTDRPDGSSSYVWYIYSLGQVNSSYVDSGRGVRPVINLLKSVIE